MFIVKAGAVCVAFRRGGEVGRALGFTQYSSVG